jgi:DNA-binding beta-propeller fold protein YncE
LISLTGCAGSASTRAEPAAETVPRTFWPPPPNEPRIQYLRSFSLSSDVERERSAIDKLVFGDEAQVLPIGKPYGVDVWNGRIYVCDITNPAVVILDLAQQETRLMLTRGADQMAQPTDIAIADDGMKYVIDRRRGRIFVFNEMDRHVGTWGDQSLTPAGVAVHGDELFVPDFTTQSVLVYDRFRGAQLRAVGGADEEGGGLIRPLGAHVDAEGSLFVGDVIRGRVQVYDADGAVTRTLGQITDTPGGFVRPKHLVVDADGVLYVVDASFQNVQMFNDQGELLMFFGGPGNFDGSMSLPAGIAVHEGVFAPFAGDVHPAFDAQRLLFVTNQFGPHRVAVYAMGRLREGYSVDDVNPFAGGMIRPPAPSSEDPGAGMDDEDTG